MALIEVEHVHDFPEEILEELRFAGIADAPGTATSPGVSLSFEAESWYVKDGALVLTNAIVDSSDRVNGIVLKTRFTLRRQFIFGPQWRWTMRDIDDSERELWMRRKRAQEEKVAAAAVQG